MIQRQITHASGMFAVCVNCKREPHHFVAKGSTKYEDTMFAANIERHQLECSCERRTGWCSTLTDALHVWDRLCETLPVPEKEKTKSNVHPIRVRWPAGR